MNELTFTEPMSSSPLLLTCRVQLPMLNPVLRFSFSDVSTPGCPINTFFFFFGLQRSDFLYNYFCLGVALTFLFFFFFFFFFFCFFLKALLCFPRRFIDFLFVLVKHRSGWS